MGAHLDKLGNLEDFRAPWQTADGSNAEIEPDRLRRWIFGVLTDKAKAQDSREEALESVKTLEADLEAAKKEAASANGEEASKKISKLEADLAKANEKVKSFEKADEQRTLRDEVLGDLDKKYAKYVTGETREELEKSLEQVKEDFGLSDGDGDEDGDDEEKEDVLRSRPRSGLKNPIPGKVGGDEVVIDFDKAADELLSGGRF